MKRGIKINFDIHIKCSNRDNICGNIKHFTSKVLEWRGRKKIYLLWGGGGGVGFEGKKKN